MIRRILLFLALLFVAFFAYRRYDRPAADTLLSKIRNLSFSSTPTYTTSITDPTTGETNIISPSTGSTDEASWFNNLIQKINDTLTDKTTWSVDERLVRTILTSENLANTVQVPGISGEVIISDQPVETLPKIPLPTIQNQNNSTTHNPITQQPSTQNTTLTPEEIAEAEAIARMFD